MYNQFYDNDDNNEEKYVRAKIKEMKCLDYKNINEFLEYIFVCCNSTTSKEIYHSKKNYKDNNCVMSPVYSTPIYTSKQHVLKPRNITFIGGKTIYGQRVSTMQ